jgi:hypothetical protein
MTYFIPRWVEGRRIVKVELRSQKDENGTHHDPVLFWTTALASPSWSPSRTLVDFTEFSRYTRNRKSQNERAARETSADALWPGSPARRDDEQMGPLPSLPETPGAERSRSE